MIHYKTLMYDEAKILRREKREKKGIKPNAWYSSIMEASCNKGARE